MEVGFCICVRVFVMCVCDMYECLKAVTNGEWRGKEHGARRAEERERRPVQIECNLGASAPGGKWAAHSGAKAAHLKCQGCM